MFVLNVEARLLLVLWWLVKTITTRSASHVTTAVTGTQFPYCIDRDSLCSLTGKFYQVGDQKYCEKDQEVTINVT